ncbi:response regulator transcription factor [Paraburkholderia saeva]|uniref:response regulator transcription factor n=1 Tax=Paraburkholderia saeva TaxID=2777537 RepID=UPI001D850CFE|nr:LuxR C-terminal-related transcriptional regulator [Paraburkholderia saeva]CAG4903935.1 HTH-type transcriptional regulator MalT [Paraburkholderia saeva]
MSRLTKRELQILALIAQGKNSYQIAGELEIAAFTVRKHRSNITRKFNLHTTAQLVSFSIKYSSPQIAIPSDIDITQPDSLSKREKQILHTLSLGLTGKEIARNLGISPRTVGKHIENIKLKTQAQSLAALMKLSVDIARKDNEQA